MYRAYVYYQQTPHDVTYALRSEAFATEDEAQVCLDVLTTICGVTGGGIEQKVEGMGWVLHE